MALAEGPLIVDPRPRVRRVEASGCLEGSAVAQRRDRTANGKIKGVADVSVHRAAAELARPGVFDVGLRLVGSGVGADANGPERTVPARWFSCDVPSSV